MTGSTGLPADAYAGATDLFTVSVNDSTTRSCARTLLAEVATCAGERGSERCVSPTSSRPRSAMVISPARTAEKMNVSLICLVCLRQRTHSNRPSCRRGLQKPGSSVRRRHANRHRPRLAKRHQLIFGQLHDAIPEDNLLVVADLDQM